MVGFTPGLGVSPVVGFTPGLGVSPVVGFTPGLGVSPVVGFTPGFGVSHAMHLSFSGALDTRHISQSHCPLGFFGRLNP